MVDVAYKPTQPYKKLYGGSVELPKYTPSYYEYLSKIGIQINLHGLGAAGTFNLLYTVPDGNTFFITYANLTSHAKSILFGYSSLVLDDGGVGAGDIIISVDNMAGIESANNIGCSFNIPLKIPEKKRFYLNANAFTTYTLWGFLVKNQDLI